MRSKKWVKIWFFCIFIAIPLVGLFNYIIDPYGFVSNKNKFVHYLRGGGPTIVNLKLNSNGDYYLIGTSRVDRIDPNIVEKYLEKKVYKINMDSSTLLDNILFAKEVKKQNKNFIFGFDASTVNKSRMENSTLQNRYETYELEFEKKFSSLFYFTSHHLFTSIRDILKRLIGTDLYSVFNSENEAKYNTTFKKICAYLGTNGESSAFNNYEVYDDQVIKDIAKLATKDDIFIIYPKFYLSYFGFYGFNDIQKKYFHAVEVLVKNTKAQVWSFYQVNDVTKDTYNFDHFGIHFKPKFSSMIFGKIFNDKSIEYPENFGYLLTKENVSIHLKKLSLEIEKHYKEGKFIIE